MPNFDEILEHIGEYDLFQKRTFLLISLLSAASHRCLTLEVAELSRRCGWTLEEELNSTVPKGETFIQQHTRYNVDWNATDLSCTKPPENFSHLNGSIPLTTCQDGWLYDFSIQCFWPSTPRKPNSW
uniref:Uncharacterized protein n=1 Tax=Anolis carolinensis TaxID=28377 RepID=A0A803TXP1_ANOCA